MWRHQISYDACSVFMLREWQVQSAKARRGAMASLRLWTEKRLDAGGLAT
jgi:hypothetical protein